MSKPTIPEVLPLIREFRETGNETGGSLHVVLDDGNVKDSDVQHYIDYAKSIGDLQGMRIGKLLLEMSRTQRKKLAGMFYEL